MHAGLGLELVIGTWGARMEVEAFAMPHSTHKRKRSAMRADRARSVPAGSGRWIATVYTEHGEKELAEAIESHPFNHQVGAPTHPAGRARAPKRMDPRFGLYRIERTNSDAS